MSEYLDSILLLLGSFFMFVASLGLLRMPDLYMRLSATTKAATLGVIFFMLAAMFIFDDPGVTGRALAIIAFIILTTPVSAHMIGRAAYLDGVPLWDQTVRDELKGQYTRRTHELTSQNVAMGNDAPASAQSCAVPNADTPTPPASGQKR